ncbi:hypothetical protein GCM10011399_21520 [Subtercola lobariae]|uniref:Uncharacterized protein n=1 Tax=Subtercola lobariae TaxID=1588641 RepID=A0A917B6Q1_9MICO|nr:hypothetical protein GCM10011399_21520 [Subtercola lobariae]
MRGIATDSCTPRCARDKELAESTRVFGDAANQSEASHMSVVEDQMGAAVGVSEVRLEAIGLEAAICARICAAELRKIVLTELPQSP